MARGKWSLKDVSTRHSPNYYQKRAQIVQKVQVEPERKDWAQMIDLYDKLDEERIKIAKEDIDNLLVFVGYGQDLSGPL